MYTVFWETYDYKQGMMVFTVIRICNTLEGAMAALSKTIKQDNGEVLRFMRSDDFETYKESVQKVAPGSPDRHTPQELCEATTQEDRDHNRRAGDLHGWER